MSLKAIEEKLKERIEIENAIKEIQSQISEEETIEKRKNEKRREKVRKNYQ
mgnify:CR=1 FL=1